MRCGSRRKRVINLNRNAQYWIDHLGLSPHPEGGYYRATYKSELTIAGTALPLDFHGDRSASTAIYFLLEGKDFSAFHRIASDEVWHFYFGSALVVYVIDPGGNESELQLGPDSTGSFSRGGESRLLVCLAAERSGGVCAGRLHRSARLRVCRFRVGHTVPAHRCLPEASQTHRRADAGSERP